MNTPIAETPYQLAIKQRPPMDRWTSVTYKNVVPNTGKVIGHVGVFDKNPTNPRESVFKSWEYIIVPTGMISESGFIKMTIQIPESDILHSEITINNCLCETNSNGYKLTM